MKLILIKSPQWQSFIAEANACKSLEFFNIKFTDDENTLIIPDGFNVNDALNIIDGYLNIVNKRECNNSESYLYDEYTKPYRGCDDGTFDYAGSFVSIIFETIKNYES